MQHYYQYLTIVGFIASVCHAFNEAKEPVVVNIYNSANASSLAHQLRTDINAMLPDTQGGIAHFAQHIDSYKNTIIDYCQRHPLKIGIVLFASSWAIITTTIFIDHYYFDHLQRWTTFKADYTYEQLKEYPKEHLRNELFKAIFSRYMNASNLRDTHRSIELFMYDIEYEIHRLFIYQRRVQFFPYPFDYMVGITQTRITQTREQLHKLTFLREMVIEWLISNENIDKLDNLSPKQNP